MSEKILRAVIGESDTGRKIKHFARGTMGVSYTQFNSLKVREGLRVNGNVVHANYILQNGDTVEIIMDETAVSRAPSVDLPVNIVYEDGDLMIIDKPAPLACQHSRTKSDDALESRLMARYGENFVFRPVNRLDKGTSGLMCAAKNAHVYQLLQSTLHSDSFVREYLAVVCGNFDFSGVIRAPMRKIDEASVKRVVDFDNGKPSVTHFSAIEPRGRFTLVRLRLETGRTHQIRCHMEYLGHSVAGDFLYGEELPELPERFALHSARIALTHPLTGKRIDISSDLPKELDDLR